MALATFKPTVIAREGPQDLAVVSQPKKHELYDHKDTPLWSLDAFLSGSPWMVTYFAQRLGSNDTPKKLDPNSTPAYQSYDRIDRLEILVQTPLSPSHRDKEQIMQVTGSATIYSFMTPNIDDYIVATSNLAKLGLFRITNVNRRTFERESVYVVEYTEEKEITSEDPEYKDLIRKVVKTMVFSKQRMIENRNPLLLRETYDKVVNLKFAYKNLVQNYFNLFFQVSSSTLLAPGQLLRHYDPMLSEFVCQIVSTMDAPQVQRMHLMSVNNDSHFQKDTLWSLLYKRGLENLPYVLRKMGKINPSGLRTPYFAKSGYFNNTDFMVVPFELDTDAISPLDHRLIDYQSPFVVPTEFVRTKTFAGLNIDLVDAVYTELPEEIPIYTPIHTLMSTYVFPDNFYNGVKTSVMEILTLDYIQRAPINLDMLTFMISYYPKMERLEQFYFGPILMVLIKEADRGAYA